ncbi:hypothetical protein LCGC14_2665020, partial [marine sediment metagenome]
YYPSYGYGINDMGLELSKWAIDNTTYKDLKIKEGDIRIKQDFKDFDLVLAVDVLEHLGEKDLDNTKQGYQDLSQYKVYERK